MGWGVVAALAVSAAIQISGQRTANSAQADAERKNKKYYAEQARLAAIATRRGASIFQDEADVFIGSQVSSYAKSGVSLSGSALLVVSQTKQKMISEKNAILTDGQFNERLAGLRARQSKDRADLLGSSRYNNLQTGGTLANTIATYMAYSGSSGGDGGTGDGAVNKAGSGAGENFTNTADLPSEPRGSLLTYRRSLIS